jgi:hypothetical protein
MHTDSATSSDISPGKRILLKAGWVAPVIVAVGLPRVGFAANLSGSTQCASTTGSGSTVVDPTSPVTGAPIAAPGGQPPPPFGILGGGSYTPPVAAPPPVTAPPAPVVPAPTAPAGGLPPPFGILGGSYAPPPAGAVPPPVVPPIDPCA